MGNAKSRLAQAIYDGNFEIVRQVLLKEPDLIDCYFDDQKTSTPLTKAIAMGRVRIVDHLIQNGADLDIQLNTGEGALSKAAKNGQITIMKKLLEAPINIETEDNSGWSPLDYAIIYGYYPMAKMLYDKGVQPKSIEFYVSSEKTFFDKKINFKELIECLEQSIEMDNKTAKARLFKKQNTKEMVFDPNETYGEMFKSLMNFDMPKMIPREDIKNPDNLPENRKFQRLRQLVNWRNTNYLETTKAKTQSDVALRRIRTQGDVELGGVRFEDLEEKKLGVKSHGEMGEKVLLDKKRSREEIEEDFEKFKF